MDADTRRLSNPALHERHEQVIRLWRPGHKGRKSVDLSGLTWPTVRRVIDRYETEGAVSLKPKDRGRASDNGRSLSATQEPDIRNLIRDRRPDKLKMEFALWTRCAVQELIGRECGVDLKISAVGNDLKRWEFSPQKPEASAHGRSRMRRPVRPSRRGHGPKAPKSTGVTRRQSSTQMFAAALMLLCPEGLDACHPCAR